jgi:hypothetical protein
VSNAQAQPLSAKPNVLLMCCECVANVLLMCLIHRLNLSLQSRQPMCCECVANVLLMCCRLNLSLQSRQPMFRLIEQFVKSKVISDQHHPDRCVGVLLMCC